MVEYALFCDGSAKHGTGYFGYVLFKNNVQIDYGYGMIGQGVKPKMSEKWALFYGLNAFIRKMDDKCPLQVFGDCKEIIEKSEKDSDVSPIIARIREYGIPVTFKWVSRDKNTLANDLARTMIDYSRIAGKGRRELKG